MAKYALISGTSSGLGLEMAQYLLEEGYHVFGFSRRESQLSHEKFTEFEVDIKDESSLIDMFEEISSQTTKLDIIVNNAGLYELATIQETSLESFEDHLSTNLVGAFLLLKYSFPLLVENVTHVINILSIGGKKGFAEAGAYCASKFGLMGLIEVAKKEWKEMGIKFTNLIPGAIDTPLWDEYSSDSDRAKMLDPEDFIYIFESVINSPHNMQLSEVTFGSKTEGDS